MDAVEFAKLIDGGEYPFILGEKETEIAQAKKLVVVYGASDDLMMFEGAIFDEVGAHGGVIAAVDKDGLISNDCDDDCPYFVELMKNAHEIEAKWSNEAPYWTYETTIPHENFMIFDDGEKYCEGIVFCIDQLE